MNQLIFDIDGEFKSELEFKSIDLYIYESSTNKKKPYVLVESKFKTGLHFSKTKNGEVKQIPAKRRGNDVKRCETMRNDVKRC